MKYLRLTILTILSALLLPLPTSNAADLSADDKKFLAGYEKVRAALAADDLNAAKQAAGELGEEGGAIAQSEKIEAARSEFSKLSERAIQLGRGQSGYYVVKCPMIKDANWLQPSGKISNPYAGKSMLECGVIKK